MTDEEKKAMEYWKTHMEILHWNTQLASEYYIKILLNLIEKQQNIIDSTKRILYDEELDYCDTLDEIYHFYEEMVNNE